MLLHDPVLAAARRLPDKVAVVDKNGRTTYRDLARAIERFAAALRAHGVARRDRVAVCLPNTVETVVAMYGALRAGAVFMPLNPQTRADKLAALLVDADAAVLVSNGPLAAAWRPALKRATGVRLVVAAGGTAEAEGPPDDGLRGPSVWDWERFVAAGGGTVPEPGIGDADLAALIYTSGSTAEPKGVMLSHANMQAVAAAVTEYLGLEERDVLYCALPLSFSYGICQLTCGLPIGATILLDTSFAFPAKSLALMAAERATCFAGVPTMYALLLAQNLQRYDLGALRLLTNAADALPEPAIAALRKTFPAARFFSMYGLTECQRASYLPPEELERRPGSVGRGMPGQRWWLLDEGGRPVPPGQTGELVVSGPHVMSGYWRQPAATAERLRPGPEGQTVLHTGDLFRSDDEGFLYFVARKDDIIKTRGEKVSPREVEAAIHSLPDVAAVAVVGVRDALLGQTIKAFVVRQQDAKVTEGDVLRTCREHLESYMIPHEIAFVDALPTTLTGKVRRKALAEDERTR